MSETRQVRQSVLIETTPELAFEAVTRASELREWCSDEAWTEVRPGGRYEVRWNSGYRADGKFVELDPPRRAAITWRGTAEPGETVVEFSVKATDAGVELTVVHRGFGPGAEWDEAVAASEKGWAGGIENLKSTLETGIDLRTARQPFLGITFDILDAPRAAKEGIAVDEGIYVQGAVEGSGAQAAGLGKGDVIVALGGRETPGYDGLTMALRAHLAGDVVDMDLVRGQKRETVQVTLGQRPQQDVPGTAEELAERLAEHCQQVDGELKAALEGLTDEAAAQSPAGEEWSVKQVLSHLSVAERDTQSFLANLALDGWLDSGPSNPTAMSGRLAAVLACTPNLEHLVGRFTADEAETVAFLRGLPAETLAHKARFRRIAQNALYGPDHTREHIAQIKSAIEVVRG